MPNEDVQTAGQTADAGIQVAEARRPTGALVAKIEDAAHALAAADNLPDIALLYRRISLLVDFAKALRADVPLANQVLAERLRCERKAGLVLASIDRTDGGRPATNSFHVETSY